jgi:hypothetical protein
MRKMLVLVLVLGLVGVAAASDLGNRAPVKAPGTYPVNVPNPERQGGDTIANATVINALPYNDSGTTVGFVDNYSASCFFAGGAPDVVYKYTVAADVTGLDIALCGSSYDTGLYVYDASLNEIACNDDFCGLQSQLDGVAVAPGGIYYIVVDGYNAASGSYVISVEADVPCLLDCPAGGVAEGEPPLQDEYVDNWNGGCNTDPGFPFQSLTADGNGNLTLCGVSGWDNFQGSQYRDTDWFILTKGPAGNIEVTVDAEEATLIFELGPQICGSAAVIQQATGGPCAEAFMTISGYSHLAPVWFWVGPTVFAPSPGGANMYEYVVWFTGLDPGTVATEPTTWGTLKALYQ